MLLSGQKISSPCERKMDWQIFPVLSFSSIIILHSCPYFPYLLAGHCEKGLFWCVPLLSFGHSWDLAAKRIMAESGFQRVLNRRKWWHHAKSLSDLACSFPHVAKPMQERVNVKINQRTSHQYLEEGRDKNRTVATVILTSHFQIHHAYTSNYMRDSSIAISIIYGKDHLHLCAEEI